MGGTALPSLGSSWRSGGALGKCCFFLEISEQKEISVVLCIQVGSLTNGSGCAKGLKTLDKDLESFHFRRFRRF